jgi:hypothetical protein
VLQFSPPIKPFSQFEKRPRHETPEGFSLKVHFAALSSLSILSLDASRRLKSIDAPPGLET